MACHITRIEGLSKDDASIVTDATGKRIRSLPTGARQADELLDGSPLLLARIKDD
jgi:hypothetical protein